MSFDITLLVAELASARSDLFAAVLGLEERVIGESVLDEGGPSRTIKDILAHIAAREAWTTEQLRMVRAGRSVDLAHVDVEGENARVLAERKHWPLCRVMAELANAHNALVFQVEQADPELLDSPHPAPWGTVRPASWLARSVEHDVLHAAELAAWRHALGLAGHKAGPGCVLVAAIAAAHEEADAWAALISDAERTTRLVCGTWTLKDVRGHVIDWERYITEALPDMLAGNLGGADYGSDLDACNARWADARRQQSCAALWDDVTIARNRLLDLLEGVSDAALATAAPSRWNPSDTVHGMAMVCFEHEREHAKGLRAALLPSEDERLRR